MDYNTGLEGIREPGSKPVGLVGYQNAGSRLVDRSGIIAAGGVAQSLMPANEHRRGFSIQNLSAEDLWISEIGEAEADQPSFRISAGALFQSPAGGCPTSAISIFGATLGQAFSAREW